MHIPDAVLDTRTAAAAGAIAVAGLGYCLSRLRGQLRERTTVLMGITSACVFAGQMVNFPIPFAPISGHLLGGVLSAVMLGPWAGACVIATVLIVQSLLCGDGGLTALGANFVNMGLIGSVVGYAMYAPIRRAIGGRAGVLIGAMAAAWFSVILASGAFAVELAASGRRADFLNVLGWMVLIHAAIGLGEAIITGLVVRFVLQVRPDLIYEPETTSPRAIRWGQVALCGLGIALAVSVFLAPLASEFPDGLEAVGARLGFIDEEKVPPPVVPAPIPDYEMPGLGWKPLATAAAGAVGTLVVFGVGLALARAFASGPAKSKGLTLGIAPDAA
jgi:cobalt/nickel transport system permease protein